MHGLSLRVTIRGVTYDTAEARLLAAATQRESREDGDEHTLLLYRSRRGHHFLVRIREGIHTLHMEPASTAIVPTVLRLLRAARRRPIGE